MENTSIRAIFLVTFNFRFIDVLHDPCVIMIGRGSLISRRRWEEILADGTIRFDKVLVY